MGWGIYLTTKTKKMKKLVVAAFLMVATMTFAQEKLTQNTIQGVLQGNQGQVVALAEAFSEEQYDWRPTEGVNSVAEALLHVAGGNYYLASKMGFCSTRRGGCNESIKNYRKS